jgi:uncharacterized protein Yka (UPF0111/DUF47 family)
MAGILDLFVPREKNFFQYINKQIVLLDKSNDLLSQIVADKKLSEKELTNQIVKIRKNANEVDDISRDINSQLHKVFITSIDREDIKSLASHLSIVVDSLRTLVTTMSYLKIRRFDKNFLEQVKIFNESVKLLKYVFHEPLSPKRNKQKLDAIKQLERDADDVYRRAVGELFSGKKNAVEIIRQKELLDSAEDAIDNIRRLVELLDTIILINS